MDLERLRRINRTLALIPPQVISQNEVSLRSVDFRQISPSRDLEKIAADYMHELPTAIRMLFYGALKRNGSNLLSYLLFEKSYCRALIQLGYEDTMRQKEDLMEFLGWCGPAE